MNKLNIIFAGTPDFAAKHLAELLKSEHKVIGVYTQPDRPSGRGKKLTASAVKLKAIEADIPVFQPANFKSTEAVEVLRDLNADLMIVVAYGLILPLEVLNIPKLGCLNVHGSLLPRWRGAAPIQRSIWAGDDETGVTIMQMNEGLDTGDMLSKVYCKISPTETSASLYEKLATLAPSALIDTINKLAKGELIPEVQDESLSSYAKKLTKEEALIDWASDGEFLERSIRAFNPWPISYFMLEGDNIKVHKASLLETSSSLSPGSIVSSDKTGIQISTGTKILNLEILQFAGKKAMPVQDILNSRKELFAVGKNLLLKEGL